MLQKTTRKFNVYHGEKIDNILKNYIVLQQNGYFFSVKLAPQVNFFLLPKFTSTKLVTRPRDCFRCFYCFGVNCSFFLEEGGRDEKIRVTISVLKLPDEVTMFLLGHRFFIFCFTDFFRNKLVSEDEIKIKIKFIWTIFQLN